ncbi:MAG: hypothetical protein DRJ56_07705 [Thermoprotei archaeon]|nr:MAG: hypothetical protein DRJ56_07705 [Thermoprotei archaeon]
MSDRSSGRVADWFSKRRRERLERLIREHAGLVTETVSSLLELLDAWREGDLDSVVKAFNRASAAEREADELRRRIVSTLMGGVLEPEERSSLLRTVREADWIADWAHEACRIAAVLMRHEVPDSVKAHCRAMAEVALQAASRVRSALEAVFESPRYVVEVSDEVERLEEEVDRLYEEARRDFITASSELPPGVAIMVAFLLDAVENVADRCEDTCDRLREVAVRTS